MWALRRFFRLTRKCWCKNRHCILFVAYFILGRCLNLVENVRVIKSISPLILQTIGTFNVTFNLSFLVPYISPWNSILHSASLPMLFLICYLFTSRWIFFRQNTLFVLHLHMAKQHLSSLLSLASQVVQYPFFLPYYVWFLAPFLNSQGENHQRNTSTLL